MYSRRLPAPSRRTPPFRTAGPLWPIVARFVLHASSYGLNVSAIVGCADAAPVTISSAVLRAPIGGANSTAAYCDIINNTRRDLRVIGATSDAIRAIEFHETVYDEDMVSMRRSDSMLVRAKDMLKLSPGGKHLMVFGLSTSQAPVVIVFDVKYDDGSRNQVAATFEVSAMGAQR